MLDEVHRSTCVRPNGCVKLRRSLEGVTMAAVVAVGLVVAVAVAVAVGVAVALAAWVVAAVVGVLSCKKTAGGIVRFGFRLCLDYFGWGLVWFGVLGGGLFII